MEQITDWLKKENSGIPYYIAWSVIFLLVWTPIIKILFELIGVDISTIPDNTEKMANSPPLLVIFTIFGEEIVFRIIPLWLAIKNKFTINGLLTISVINSLVFGYIHGNILNLPFQSVMGMIFCLLFLKCGGIKSNFLPACLAPITSHFLYDAIRFAVVVLL